MLQCYMGMKSNNNNTNREEGMARKMDDGKRIYKKC